VLLPVPEIRDYLQVNRRLVQLLDAGTSVIRLIGVERQRLLAAGLKGSWTATIEIDGEAGPELAAELAAPYLLIVARGSAADGAARGLAAGRVVLECDAGPAVGYGQRGGVILALGSVEARAGLEQRGGLLVIAGACGPLAGERQAGGTLALLGERIGPGLGTARRAGVIESPHARVPTSRELSRQTIDELERLTRDARVSRTLPGLSEPARPGDRVRG
jgi:formylmethanofuran dehydrogenase subunit C